MLVERGIVSFNEVPEAFATAKRVLKGGGFCGDSCPESGGAHCG